MLTLIYSNAFKKDLKKADARNKDMKKISAIIETLRASKELHPKHRNHKLHGNYIGYWECHIEPDWLFVYRKTSTELICHRTGTHADLF